MSPTECLYCGRRCQTFACLAGHLVNLHSNVMQRIVASAPNEVRWICLCGHTIMAICRADRTKDIGDLATEYVLLAEYLATHLEQVGGMASCLLTKSLLKEDVHA